MPPATINKTLLERVLGLIEEKPDKWAQESWVTSSALDEDELRLLQEGKYGECGTTGCVAGWALIFSQDWRPRLSEPNNLRFAYVHDVERVSDGKSITEIAQEMGLRPDDLYMKEGARLLGLDQEDAHYIFIEMSYNSDMPLTFTDRVRDYLGLSTKHGARFNEHNEIVEAAEGERETWREYNEGPSWDYDS